LTPEAHGSIERVRRSEVEHLGNPTESAADAFESQHSGGN
jgi:hypothetical protein